MSDHPPAAGPVYAALFVNALVDYWKRAASTHGIQGEWAHSERHQACWVHTGGSRGRPIGPRENPFTPRRGPRVEHLPLPHESFCLRFATSTSHQSHCRIQGVGRHCTSPQSTLPPGAIPRWDTELLLLPQFFFLLHTVPFCNKKCSHEASASQGFSPRHRPVPLLPSQFCIAGGF